MKEKQLNFILNKSMTKVKNYCQNPITVGGGLIYSHTALSNIRCDLFETESSTLLE